jgi:hypothetical protein
MSKKYQIGSSTAITVAYAATMEINPTESRTIATIDLTGAGTLDIGDEATPQVGDELILKVSSDGTARDLTLGTGITGPVLTGVINKTKVQTFVYDGSNFIATAAAVQID